MAKARSNGREPVRKSHTVAASSMSPRSDRDLTLWCKVTPSCKPCLISINKATINIQDKNGKAKPYQVKQVLAAIEKIEHG